jgi:hypothetical protein
MVNFFNTRILDRVILYLTLFIFALEFVIPKPMYAFDINFKEMTSEKIKESLKEHSRKGCPDRSLASSDYRWREQRNKWTE